MHTGYLVVSKPKYRPNDTVKFKAFITDKKGNPISDNRVIVKVGVRYDEYDELRILGTTTAYRKGAFEFKFVLTDSLDLDLDDQQFIYLEKFSEKAKTVSEDEDDDYYELSHKKFFIKGEFEYEDYELKDLSFSAHAEKRFQIGEPVALYMKAVDENDMTVPDGKVKILIKTLNVSNLSSKNHFIPDTLWSHTQTLDPVGETRIEVPADKFPEGDFYGQATIEFTNSDNQRFDRSLSFERIQKVCKLVTKCDNDTIKLSWLIRNKENNVTATVTGFSNDGDTISTTPYQIPGAFKINSAVSFYSVKVDSSEEKILVADLLKEPTISAQRTGDSLFVFIDNPQKHEFHYSILANKKIIAQGKSSEFSLATSIHTPKNCKILLHYFWGGEPKIISRDVPALKKRLNIQTNLPALVYPGQKLDVEVTVNDANNKPVEEADLTAYGFTSKFKENSTPFVPYFGKQYFSYQPIPPSSVETTNESGNLLINWKRWAKELNLDTIEYYRFLNTPSVYKNIETTHDGTSQLAPFTVKKGQITPVHILYVDEIPVYFSKTTQLNRYSFNVGSGYHSIRLRTSSKMIRLDSVFVPASAKLILSINIDSLRSFKNTKVISVTDTLTDYESKLLNKYLIVVDNNFNSNPAWIDNYNRIFFLNPNFNKKQPAILAGPLNGLGAKFNLYKKFDRHFSIEPDYTYTFESDLLKMKSIERKFPFSNKLDSIPFEPDFEEFEVTKTEIDSLWQYYLDMRSHTTPLFQNAILPYNASATLQINLGKQENGVIPFVKNIILYNYTNPDFIRFYPGNRLNIGRLEAGEYRIFFLLKENRYFMIENVIIKPNGFNFITTGTVKPLKRDSTSLKIARLIESKDNDKALSYYDNTKKQISEAFNESYFSNKQLTRSISGLVVDETDQGPLPGVSIQVKGTPYGTMSDANGHFYLRIPPNGTLLVTFVGYQTQEIPIDNSSFINVTMHADLKMLQEVVVTGYGVQQQKKSLSLSDVQMEGSFQGKVAGIAVGSSNTIRIRGLSSISGNASPMILVDGLPFSGKQSDIDPNTIQEVKLINGEEAIKLYGAMASSGVILITTQKPSNNTHSENSVATASVGLRKNFSDEAFWQPHLTTDKNGKAKFKMTMPDDISKWNTYVIGMGGNKLTGFLEKSIKSFKSLTASLAVPRFAIEGDSINILGKISNYTFDETTVERRISLNGKAPFTKTIKVVNAFIDTIPIMVNTKDSINVLYSLVQSSTDYSDGEERKIPVYDQGVKETNGVFYALEGDTSIHIKLKPDGGKITFRAEASALPVLLSEAKHIRNYEYYCNEQLASKLKALIVEKKIKALLKEPFDGDKDINEIIKKLNANQQPTGHWGWWPNSADQSWITNHVVGALNDAKKAGFKADNFNKQGLIDELMYRFTRESVEEKIRTVKLLQALEAKPDFNRMISQIEDSISTMKFKPSDYTLLNLMHIKQSLGLKVDIEVLKQKHKSTMFGNWYWGNNGYHMFNNSIQETLLSYKILKSANTDDHLLTKIRNYFFEQRKDGKWRNTYESSLILETLLPDLLKDSSSLKPVKLVLNDNKNETVEKFPYETSYEPSATITVNKTGTLPAYITAYQQNWNKNPMKSNKDFEVRTWFEKNNKEISFLAAGDKVVLQAVVKVKADAEYVMIEIPIPSGCSYGDKENYSYYRNSSETHREYLKNKVSIFCTKLTQGTYTYTINLIPRFGGRYILNPAKAEMMYFPVFFGREEMKKVDIK
ncbi:Alpha-2-macroglobulin family protein [compost metagenome]